MLAEAPLTRSARPTPGRARLSAADERSLPRGGDAPMSAARRGRGAWRSTTDRACRASWLAVGEDLDVPTRGQRVDPAGFLGMPRTGVPLPAIGQRGHRGLQRRRRARGSQRAGCPGAGGPGRSVCLRVRWPAAAIEVVGDGLARQVLPAVSSGAACQQWHSFSNSRWAWVLSRTRLPACARSRWVMGSSCTLGKVTVCRPRMRGLRRSARPIGLGRGRR